MLLYKDKSSILWGTLSEAIITKFFNTIQIKFNQKGFCIISFMRTIKRKKTRQILIGNIAVGGGAPIVVQSMTKTPTTDIKATLKQIRRLAQEGCEIVRVAIPDNQAVEALKQIKNKSPIPIIADIHFDWRLAIGAIDAGVDALRINPGNIGAAWKTKEVVKRAKEKGVPIRVGANSGSLPKDIILKYTHPCPEALVEAVERQMELLWEEDFHLIKVSLKATDVMLTVDAYRAFSEKYDYPLHIGITEAGPPPEGIVKSSVGLGILLSEGIGDTIRVSLTAAPWLEVEVAYQILQSLGLRQKGINLISCPTCGRCKVDMVSMVRSLRRALKDIDKPITVAVMGCAVNGPGEAREADIGIAGAGREALLFKKGTVIKKVNKQNIVDELLDLIRKNGDN